MRRDTQPNPVCVRRASKGRPLAGHNCVAVISARNSQTARSLRRRLMGETSGDGERHVETMVDHLCCGDK
jgi:hypothetical protein